MCIRQTSAPAPATTPASEGSARNAWPGRITAVEPVGDRFRVQIDAEPPVVAEVTAAAVRDIGMVDGAEIWVAVKATEIDVYPA